ncbi:hypothetical protein V2A60_006432 [Cordyceps javanica]
MVLFFPAGAGGAPLGPPAARSSVFLVRAVGGPAEARALPRLPPACGNVAHIGLMTLMAVANVAHIGLMTFMAVANAGGTASTSSATCSGPGWFLGPFVHVWSSVKRERGPLLR